MDFVFRDRKWPSRVLSTNIVWHSGKYLSPLSIILRFDVSTIARGGYASSPIKKVSSFFFFVFIQKKHAYINPHFFFFVVYINYCLY